MFKIALPITEDFWYMYLNYYSLVLVSDKILVSVKKISISISMIKYPSINICISMIDI